MSEVRIILLLFNNLNLFGHVLRVRVAVEVAVGGPSEPVVAGLQLIVEVFIVIAFGLFFHIGVSICAFASQGERSTSMLVSGFDVLVISSVAGELGRVGAELSSRSIAVQKVLRVRPFDLVTIISREASSVDGVDIKMWTLQLIVLFIVVDVVGDGLLFVETPLVDGIFGEIGLDDLEFAVMSATFAILA